MPFVAWAVAFLGAYVGARFGDDAASPRSGLLMVIVGAALGAIVGAGLWTWALRWSARQMVMVRRRRQREEIRRARRRWRGRKRDDDTTEEASRESADGSVT
jgi:membrane protein DedA with SNARE-associated domain